MKIENIKEGERIIKLTKGIQSLLNKGIKLAKKRENPEHDEIHIKSELEKIGVKMNNLISQLPDNMDDIMFENDEDNDPKDKINSKKIWSQFPNHIEELRLNQGKD